jgi:hypothetical protein
MAIIVPLILPTNSHCIFTTDSTLGLLIVGILLLIILYLFVMTFKEVFINIVNKLKNIISKEKKIENNQINDIVDHLNKSKKY